MIAQTPLGFFDGYMRKTLFVEQGARYLRTGEAARGTNLLNTC